MGHFKSILKITHITLIKFKREVMGLILASSVKLAIIDCNMGGPNK